MEVLDGFGAAVRVLTSKSADASPLIERSFFSAPCNRASLILRLIQEIFLGVDLGLRIFLKRRKTKLCLITSPPFFHGLHLLRLCPMQWNSIFHGCA